MMDLNDLWLKYAEELKNLATSGMFDEDKHVFSIAGTNLAVDLGNRDSEVAAGYIYQIGNTIPAYSPSYAPHSSLAASYNIFLDCINLKGDSNPNLDSQINLALAALNTSQANFLKVQSTANALWQSSGSILSFEEWVPRNYPVYRDAKKDLDAKRSKWNSLMSQRYGAGFSVLQAALDKLGTEGGALDILEENSYNMPIKSGTIAPAGSVAVLPGQDPSSPSAALKSTFAPSYVLQGFTERYQEWQTASTEGKLSGGTITINGSSSTAQLSKMGWGASAKADFKRGFFGIGVSGKVTRDSLACDTKNQKFSFEVSFTGLGTFLVNPGQWFDLGLVETYHNQLRKDSPKFFGPEGSMALLPYAIVVGFEPRIKLTLASNDYHEFKSKFAAAATASLNLGPFQLGHANFSTYSAKEKIDYNDSAYTIEVGPIKSTMPFLLGVISAKL